MQMLYYNEVTGEEEQRCRYCPQTYATSESTSGLGGHLISKHGFEKGDGQDAKAQQIQQSIKQALEIAAANPQKRRRLDTDTIKQDKLEVLWVRAVAACNLHF